MQQRGLYTGRRGILCRVLVWQLHSSRRRSCSCCRLQHAMHWKQQRVLRWPKSSQSLQVHTGHNNSWMGVSRLLHVSHFLVHVLGQFSTLFFLISDNVVDRTLPFPVGVTGNTGDVCTAACFNAGYRLAGTEYSAECWCGTSIKGTGVPAAIADCNMPCTGDNTKSCGGPNRLNLYNYTGTITTPPPPPPPPPPPGTGTVSPVTNLPGGWTYNGCWM